MTTKNKAKRWIEKAQQTELTIYNEKVNENEE